LFYENVKQTAKYVGVGLVASFATVAGIQDSAYIDKNFRGKESSTACEKLEADQLPRGPRLLLDMWFDKK